MAAGRAVLAIAAKDILTWFRTPSAILASLLPPVAFLLIIFVVAGAVGRNPVALVVEDSGPQAQRLVSILENSDAFRVRRADPVEATHLLDTFRSRRSLRCRPRSTTTTGHSGPTPSACRSTT
ncbi:hypothetical protein ACSBOX_10785 [Arthrobacter sp. KN11-1C]|uniref:hypothetical protein n=1 Tax=Arthrobacter sp. KN11-1C TaxID=3445774 RepID=UPI003FA0F578